MTPSTALGPVSGTECLQTMTLSRADRKAQSCRLGLPLILCFTNIYIFSSRQTVKNLPAMQEIQIKSLGREDPIFVIPPSIFHCLLKNATSMIVMVNLMKGDFELD